MDGPRSNIFEHESGEWWAECLVCGEWVSTSNATRDEAAREFLTHLECEPHPTRLCVWAMVETGDQVTQDVLNAVDAAWPSDDESFCSSPDDKEPEVLTLSFDLFTENEDHDAAFVRARKAVIELVERVGLPPNVRPLIGYTDTHEWRETS